MKIILSTATIVFVISFYSVSFSQSLVSQSTDNKNLNLELIGQIGGFPNSVSINGDHAYLADGKRVTVFDISDKNSLYAVGVSKVHDSFIKDITIEDNKLFVSASDAGLYIYDIANPENLEFIYHYNTLGYVENTIALGNVAFLADGWNGITEVYPIVKTKKQEI